LHENAVLVEFFAYQCVFISDAAVLQASAVRRWTGGKNR
jgi:hypothetical protein